MIAAEAQEFLLNQADGSRPFFLYFAPNAPHLTSDPDNPSRWSVEPAPRHIDRFAGTPPPLSPSIGEDDVSDKPRYIRRLSQPPAEGLTELREEQLEALLAVDDAIATMIGALEQIGKLQNTIIIFTSDNGYSWGEHRWTQKNGPYEESIRVPLVVRYDALQKPARVERRMVVNVDLAPTLTRAAGRRIAGREGRSILPLLRNRTGVSWRNRVLSEHGDAHPGSWCMLRDEGWKYVQYGTKEEELYRLDRDPYELRNLAAEPRLRARVMQGRARVSQSSCRPPDGFRPLPLCSLKGSDDRDAIRGTRWRDWVCARGGNDVIHVRGNLQDVVRCGKGRDTAHVGPEDRTSGCERVVLGPDRPASSVQLGLKPS